MSDVLFPPTGACYKPVIRWTGSPGFGHSTQNQSHWHTVIRWTETAKPTALSEVSRIGLSQVSRIDVTDLVLRFAGRLSLFLCALLALALLYVVGLCIYRLWFHPLARYPGPILGKLTNLYGGYHAWKGDLHVDMWRCHERYGDYVRYAPNRLLVNTNTGMKSIYGYSKNFQKSKVYNAMVHRAPNTLTHIDKEGHGRKRRIISQGFSDASLRAYEPTIMQHIQKLCAGLMHGTPSGPSTGSKWSPAQNMAKWSNYLTFDIMSSVVFGEAFRLLSEPSNRFVVDSIERSNVRTSVLVQAAEVSTRRIDRWLFPDAIGGRNAFIGFVNKLLKARMTTGELKRRDVFSFLLDAKDPRTGKGLSVKEIGAESTTMIVAGSDTSSTAIASTIFYLTRNPAAYLAAASEVRSAFPDPSAIHLGATLNSCVYLRACIDESLRMSPPAASALWREIITPDGVTLDDTHRLPAGVEVGTCIYAIHHNPAYYPEAFAYRPERWIDDASSSNGNGIEPAVRSPAVQRALSAYTPFSIGPRACIGKGLALAELMLALATILRTFDFEAVDGDEGRLGAGHEGAEYGRHREGEFQLRDHVTAAKDGPVVRFRERKA